MSRTVYYDHSGNEVDPPKADTVKPTNADRIRSMTDEELAGILAMPSIISPPWCSEKYDCPYADQDPVRCDLCALDWLREEEKE